LPSIGYTANRTHVSAGWSLFLATKTTFLSSLVHSTS